MSRAVRVRFAPSPTGPLHMGGVRTALFNYLFAKHYGGKFLLRIEDTDQTRFVPGAEEYILETFRWCNIAFDESPEKGGPHAPYRQSERKHIYHEYALRLVAEGKAYYAFDTEEELEAMRERLKQDQSSVQQYNALTRGSMRNSFTIDPDEVKSLINSGTPYVIRFNMPADELIVTEDIIRGKVEFHTAQLDDKVLYKSDGMPTYHLANVVDDHLMEISHVIRGEEWLPSLPLHVMLYRAFGWTDTMPEFAHLPLLLKPSGKGKLSKRDGDQLGFPVFPLQWQDPKTGETASGYREAGYFADAFINLLALLGWNPGTEQEIFTINELAEIFDLNRVGKSGARFDPKKAVWFNHQYMQMQNDRELAGLFLPLVEEKGHSADIENLTLIVSRVKERANFVSDLWEQTAYFFESPSLYDPQVIKKRWHENIPAILNHLSALYAGMEPFTAANAEEKTKEYIGQHELNAGQIMNCLRLCLTGGSIGIHLFDIMEIIGKDETLARIAKAVATIQ